MKTPSKNFFRKWHRDIAYFYVGLILSFSISGIALNHRRTFDSRKYVYQSESFQFSLPKAAEAITDDYIQGVLPEIGVTNDFRSYRVRDGVLRIFYEDAIVDINVETGEGEKEFLRKRILLGEMADLHQTTNKWWVWYSDIFGIGMILIACSGMFIAGGKDSFKKRGWYLAIIGLVFPLIFLILLI